MRTRLLAALVAASVALVGCSDGDEATGAANPSSADLDFQAMSVGGESVDVGAYAGSDLVIWFWAPW